MSAPCGVTFRPYLWLVLAALWVVSAGVAIWRHEAGEAVACLGAAVPSAVVFAYRVDEEQRKAAS